MRIIINYAPKKILIAIDSHYHDYIEVFLYIVLKNIIQIEFLKISYLDEQK